MPKNKHRKFAELNIFPNVVQPEYRYPVFDYHLKGAWGEKFFHNENPVLLELGCGKGEYTIGLADLFPEKNFIGIDIKGNRLWTGAKLALERAMTNVGFLRIQAEHLASFFSKDEISGIWITFPEPQTNKPKEKKRFTSERYLNIFKNFLKPDAPIYLKTDNRDFFDYTLDVIARNNHLLRYSTTDLYNEPGLENLHASSIQTYYEKMFLEKGEKICYLEFSLNKD